MLLDQPYLDKRIEIFTDQQKKFTPARNQPSGGEFKLHGSPTRVKRAVGLTNFRCTDVSGSHCRPVDKGGVGGSAISLVATEVARSDGIGLC